MGKGCAAFQIPAGDPVVAMTMETQPHMCGGGRGRCNVEGLINSVGNIQIKKNTGCEKYRHICNRLILSPVVPKRDGSCTESSSPKHTLFWICEAKCWFKVKADYANPPSP